ncbi:hypothetical protein ANANG_G00225670 [Anguilla anguilla]|uniref:Uncharacterized protein n=1 Tax=Anguilla anguilla TaxID=7936 RepID=A0A9D3RT44_ANGAN|nr:hypothetical protein ANANG_G00225670 [Anguilla anguilla]
MKVSLQMVFDVSLIARPTASTKDSLNTKSLFCHGQNADSKCGKQSASLLTETTSLKTGHICGIWISRKAAHDFKKKDVVDLYLRPMGVFTL